MRAHSTCWDSCVLHSQDYLAVGEASDRVFHCITPLYHKIRAKSTPTAEFPSIRTLTRGCLADADLVIYHTDACLRNADDRGRGRVLARLDWGASHHFYCRPGTPTRGSSLQSC
ncbi:BQ5605_C028g10527 [Microbotryum silenes-dioicae]|uniref:BQ5605_C028g10527 protein n=1 Tax=Microbotryum silenes-dioicae TaxID=796604 RepID=A0A2X0PJP8_9BASI|nr:BQ5605_C028g10527 [Microbotryum silenes-dioicae]